MSDKEKDNLNCNLLVAANIDPETAKIHHVWPGPSNIVPFTVMPDTITVLHQRPSFRLGALIEAGVPAHPFLTKIATAATGIALGSALTGNLRDAIGFASLAYLTSRPVLSSGVEMLQHNIETIQTPLIREVCGNLVRQMNKRQEP